VTPDAAALVEQADAAAAAGDLQRTEALLLQVIEGDGQDLSVLLKLAAIQRATGRPQIALTTVHRALSLSPLDFTALLMRATLLDRVDPAHAPEAWLHALAQEPEGGAPPHLRDVVARGKTLVERLTHERDLKLKAAMSTAEASADPDERARLERFRSNVLRRTRPYHSEPTHFHFPGLAEREFYPRHLFPWLDELEDASEVIASEMRAVMAAERAELVPYVQYEDHQPLAQWRALNHNPDWTAIHLIRNGETIGSNAALCPRTMDLIGRFDQPRIRGASPNAMFSLLAPNTAIPPHVGVNNSRLVCHLPLVIPEGCWFRVGAETRYWTPGEAFVFDDTIEHEALNPTDQLRVVFIFDLWHPEISPAERAGITALIECDGVSGTPL
jgi:aspartyl/asparaginyl beta-hydroxylase (cupin superfamily)